MEYNLPVDVSPLSQLKTVSTVDALAEELKELVLDGKLEHGERLREVEWSSRYRVGRQTFRAAAQLLCQQGLLVKAPNPGFFVRRFDRREISDLFRVRRLLELEAVRSVVESRDVPRAATEAVREMTELDAKAPWRAVVDADQRFHGSLIEACGSPHLTRCYKTVESEVILSMVARPLDSRAEQAAEHRELLQLLRGGDIDLAEGAFIEHLRLSERNLISAEGESQDGESISPTSDDGARRKTESVRR